MTGGDSLESSESDVLLDVRDLAVSFGGRATPIRAVDGVSFRIPADSTVALVGESGCGKSVTALSLAQLVPMPPAIHSGGSIRFRGEEVTAMSRSRLRELRGDQVAYVFQEPAAALNPVLSVGHQVAEAVRVHRHDVKPREEAVRLLQMVSFPDPKSRMRAYPHELSGGMQQRVVLAMALASRPELLVADEPTTALDVTIQAQILDLLGRLQRELGMAVLLITHNLGLVAETADHVHVMYAGRIVESGPTRDVLVNPRHPYTAGLLAAVPSLGEAGSGCRGIPGSVPSPERLPAGCKFHPRCDRSTEICQRSDPQLARCEGEASEHCVRCHHPLDVSRSRAGEGAA